MPLSYSDEVSQNFKDKILWWNAKLNNVKSKVWQDPWFHFILCWMIFDAYLTEISQCDQDRDKLNYFYCNDCDFKERALNNWSPPIKLKELSPVDDMRPNLTRKVYLNNENDLKQVFDFIYQIRCNLFHGAKDIKNYKDAELVRHGAKFLQDCINKWLV